MISSLTIAITAGAMAASSAFGQISGFIQPPNGKYSITGCRNDGTILLPSANNDELRGFVCPTSVYTGGNLQKNWNELDLVPFRLTTSTQAGASINTYNVIVVGEYIDGGHLGWDVIDSDDTTSGKNNGPTKNPTSDTSCYATWLAQHNDGPSASGSDASIYRVLTITQSPGTTCVWDYYMRLALGSHLYPGSSLHGFIFLTGNFTQAAQDVPLPVNQIKPQVTSKTQTSSQGSDHTWTVTKSANPANIDITNTCSNTTATAPVTITVTWKKLAAAPGGPVTVVATILATNPASRLITVNGTDRTFKGSLTPGQGQELSSSPQSFGPVDVPAQSSNFPVATITTVDDNPGSVTLYNDAVTVTYTDKVTGFDIPGNTTAGASSTVQYTGPEKNTTASIVDTETISDTYGELQYTLNSASSSQGTISCSPAPSTTPVTKTTCNITGLSSAAAKTDSGTITLVKTISVKDTGAVVLNGNLHDEAVLTANDGFSPDNGKVDVKITSEAQVSLTVTKAADVVPSAQNFAFGVAGTALTNYSTSQSLAFAVGDKSKSFTLPGLVPDAYTATETQNPNYTIKSLNPQTFNFGPFDGKVAACVGPLDFSNELIPQLLTVSKTVSTSFRRTYHWSITKGVTSNSLGTTPANSVTTNASQVTFNYSINAAETGFSDDNFVVSGAITVTNPNFYTVNNVTISDGTCTVTPSTVASIAPGGSVNATYTCGPFATQAAAPTSNTATVTWTPESVNDPGKNSSSPVAVGFGSPSARRVCDPTNTTCAVGNVITVTDSFNGATPPKILGTLTATDTQPYASGTFPDSATVTVTIAACKSYDNTAAITETGQNAKATVSVCGIGGELTPTVTTCSTYNSGTNKQLSGVNYSDDGSGKIGQNLNPGVFFYFTKFVAAKNGGGQTITITEANDGTPGKYNFTAQSAQLFNSSCGSLSPTVNLGSTTPTSSPLAVTLSGANLTNGATYIVAVKYSAKSVAGQSVVGSTGGCDSTQGDACYSFTTFLNGVNVDHNSNPFVLTKNPVIEF